MVMKRIVICADGTWNRPEADEKDCATNVLKLARGINSVDSNGIFQQVFYDWGVGSYYNAFIGGVTGKGIEKNVLDCYRYIVQNYSDGDGIFLFGFSRGAYTVRSLSGLIYNCGIIKRENAKLINKAFEHYKNPNVEYKPSGSKSIEFRENYSNLYRDISFIGVWDTVGALGIPFSVLGLFDKKDEFYDTKMGANIKAARHALAIDEFREDFRPTIWKGRKGMNLKQVWFAGAHSDVGGGYQVDEKRGTLLSDIPLKWMIDEAESFGLSVEGYVKEQLSYDCLTKLHNSRTLLYRSQRPYHRKIARRHGDVIIHPSVRERWELDPNYRPENLAEYFKESEK